MMRLVLFVATCLLLACIAVPAVADGGRGNFRGGNHHHHGNNNFVFGQRGHHNANFGIVHHHRRAFLVPQPIFVAPQPFFVPSASVYAPAFTVPGGYGSLNVVVPGGGGCAAFFSY